MCSTPKMPAASTGSTQTVATPTYADAAQTKSAASKRIQTSANAGRDIRTSSQGDESAANTKKKKLLGE